MTTSRIVLNRPDTRNAQDTAFLHALNEPFDRAAHGGTVKLIVLSANGPHFSSGHDLREVDGHGKAVDPTSPMLAIQKHETAS